MKNKQEKSSTTAWQAQCTDVAQPKGRVFLTGNGTAYYLPSGVDRPTATVYGFFHNSCIYESAPALVSLHATKAGAWRAMHSQQWQEWQEHHHAQRMPRRHRCGAVERGVKIRQYEESTVRAVPVLDDARPPATTLTPEERQALGHKFSEAYTGDVDVPLVGLGWIVLGLVAALVTCLYYIGRQAP